MSRRILIIGLTALTLGAAASCKGGGGGGSTLPTAVLRADRASGVAPLSVNFDASSSDDPDGRIEEYQWDWEGDGTYDATTTNARVSHVYPAAGTFAARLRVEDDSGNIATDTLSIRVLSGNWETQALDTVGNVGTYTSAALIDGRPAIAYGDETNQRLSFVIAASAAGTSWGTPLTVVPGSRSNLQPSLAEIGGRPAIAYIDSNLGQVQYVRALDNDGDSWSDPVPVGIASTITDVALFEVDGRPAVVFLDAGQPGDGEAVYIRATNANGTAWTAGVLIDDVGEDVGAVDALVVNGVPAAAYVEEVSRDLRFVQAEDRDGDSWFLPVDAVETGAVGNMISLALVDGVPAVSYLDTSAGQGNLYYVRAVDRDGVDWHAAVGVDLSGLSTGQYSSLAVIGGRPAISYLNLTSGRLEYVEANDVEGESWAAPLVADDGESVGLHTSLLSVGGSPGISYYDQHSGDLKWALLE